jgi:hypothetical protein
VEGRLNLIHLGPRLLASVEELCVGSCGIFSLALKYRFGGAHRRLSLSWICHTTRRTENHNREKKNWKTFDRLDIKVAKNSVRKVLSLHQHCKLEDQIVAKSEITN